MGDTQENMEFIKSLSETIPLKSMGLQRHEADVKEGRIRIRPSACMHGLSNGSYFDTHLGKDPPFKPGVKIDLIMRTVNMEVVISKAQRVCFQVKTDVL